MFLLALLNLAKYGFVRVSEKSGSRAAALQIATSQCYALAADAAHPVAPGEAKARHEDGADYG